MRPFQLAAPLRTDFHLHMHPHPGCALPADVLESQVDPAAWEIAGHIVLKRQQDYDEVTQEGAWRLLELASCSEQRFAEVARLALDGLL